MSLFNANDQGEWERCRSSRRMFLCLSDAGREQQLQAITAQLLKLARKHLPKDRRVREAVAVSKVGLLDDHGEKEIADRYYVVMRLVAEAFDSLPNKSWSGGGEAVVVEMIRREVPAAPAGFHKAGRLEGASSEAGISRQCIPHRAFAPNGRSAVHND